MLYIYEKQLEEADLIVLNKADRLSAGELAELTDSLAARFPGKPLLTMSALAGEGVDDWLEFVAEQRPAGQHVVEVDYDTYAAGEAALGWLNASVALHARGPVDWQAFAEELLEKIRREVAGRGRRDRPRQADYRSRRRERDRQSHEQLWVRLTCVAGSIRRQAKRRCGSTPAYRLGRRSFR